LCLVSHCDCCLWSFPALLFSSLVTATIFFAFFLLLYRYMWAWLQIVPVDTAVAVFQTTALILHISNWTMVQEIIFTTLSVSRTRSFSYVLQIFIFTLSRWRCENEKFWEKTPQNSRFLFVLYLSSGRICYLNSDRDILVIHKARKKWGRVRKLNFMVQ
jgi:hypothetical protein